MLVAYVKWGGGGGHMLIAPKPWTFASFWSENGYGFRRNYGSVWSGVVHSRLNFFLAKLRVADRTMDSSYMFVIFGEIG